LRIVPCLEFPANVSWLCDWCLYKSICPDDVSELDIHVLARILKNKEWAEEELSMLKGFWEMEKSYRLSVSKK